MAIKKIINDNSNTTRLMRWCKRHSGDECRVLTKAEETAMIEEWRDRDPDRLRQMLVLHNVAIVFNVATKWMSAVNSYDDMVQRGMQALALAATKFDISQTKTKFSTYAYFWIYKYVNEYGLDEMYGKNVLNGAVSLDGVIDRQTPNIKPWEDDSGSISNYLEDHLDPNQTGCVVDTEAQMVRNRMEEVYEDLRKYILTDDFTDLDRKVFDGAFVFNLNNRRISVDYDIPLDDVKSSRAKILRTMRAKLAESGIESLDEVF